MPPPMPGSFLLNCLRSKVYHICRTRQIKGPPEPTTYRKAHLELCVKKKNAIPVRVFSDFCPQHIEIRNKSSGGHSGNRQPQRAKSRGSSTFSYLLALTRAILNVQHLRDCARLAPGHAEHKKLFGRDTHLQEHVI